MSFEVGEGEIGEEAGEEDGGVDSVKTRQVQDEHYRSLHSLQESRQIEFNYLVVK